MNRKKGWQIVGAICAGLTLVVTTAIIAFPAVSQIAGLAVAQTPTLWNSVIDASKGDGQTNGILGESLYMYNGATFDRARGDTTNGLDVDVTRMPGGVFTPADGVTNPTGLQGSETFCMLFNGSTWDRCRGSVANGMLVEKKTVGAGFFSVKRNNITTSSVNLSFGLTSRKVALEFPSTNTDEVCVDWAGGTAVCPSANTSGDDRFAPGDSIILDDFAQTSVSIISASGTQTVYVRAWN